MNKEEDVKKKDSNQMVLQETGFLLVAWIILLESLILGIILKDMGQSKMFN